MIIPKHFIKIVFLLLAVFFMTEAKAQTASFDVTDYDARIEPDIMNKSVKGKVVVKFNSLKNNLSEIQLNAGVLEIDAAREGKSVLKFEKRESVLIVSLARPARV